MNLEEQRLNSNHGRLVRAARAVPEQLRHGPMACSGRTPRDVLAHVLAWQEEALRRLRDPGEPWPARDEMRRWSAAAHERMGAMPWDEIMARLEATHERLKAHLDPEPPAWFGRCTYRHYTVHTRSLLDIVRGRAQSSTTTVAPIRAQS